MDLKGLTTQLRLAAKDTDSKHFRAVFREAAEKLEKYDKALRTAHKRESTWKRMANRQAKELKRKRKVSEPSGQSVRTVQGGAYGLGKNRRN